MQTYDTIRIYMRYVRIQAMTICIIAKTMHSRYLPYMLNKFSKIREGQMSPPVPPCLPPNDVPAMCGADRDERWNAHNSTAGTNARQGLSTCDQEGDANRTFSSPILAYTCKSRKIFNHWIWGEGLAKTNHVYNISGGVLNSKPDHFNIAI